MEMDYLKKIVEGIKLVSQDEAEKCDFVVCGYPPASIPDSVGTFCSSCGTGIVHKRTAPKAPKKICYACLPKETGDEAAITGDALQDIKACHTTNEGIVALKKKFGL